MNVKNEEKNLADRLKSLRGLFDEIVIFDTGSTDRTKEIAREFAAKVFDYVWVDSFAAARNEALSHATRSAGRVPGGSRGTGQTGARARRGGAGSARDGQ